MDLTYPPEAEAFRLEVRGWLEEHLPAGWGQPGFSLTHEQRSAFNHEWTKKLAEGGWICASWPREYGGRGLSLMESVVLNEEFARLNAPMRADFFGDTLVGPTILKWGSEEQKQFFLPKILSGDPSWEEMVPEEVAEIIRQRKLFGWHEALEAAECGAARQGG